MNEQESSSSSSSSWLLRTRFSRAPCYRLGTSNPSSSWLALPPTQAALCAENGPQSPLRHQPPALQKQVLAAAIALHTHNVQACNGPEFSFPSPSFSSSSASRVSDSSWHSKSRLSCDEEICVASLQPAGPSCSPSQGDLLRSFMNAYSAASDRMLTSSDGTDQLSSPNSSSKASWFSWISPLISPKSSSKVSPAASPANSRTSSPTSSFRNSTFAEDPCNKDDSMHSQSRFDTLRALSWSQHLSSGDNERAVLAADKWMVNLSQLLLGDRFATGNHCRIYRGIYQDSHVAVKVIRQPDGDSLLSDRLEQSFINEVTTLSSLDHRNIVKFVAACKKPPVLCIITEYLSGGSLRAFLHKQEGRLLPIGEVLRMALNIAAGMEYIHMKGVIHRDLKSENLVLGEDGCVKIIDFGASCSESCCDYKADIPGTYRWMAPEMLRHKPYTKMVDVYSFGIVVWELLTGRVPYEEMSAVQAAFCVLHKNLRPPIPPSCPSALENLMCRCWSTDPNTRPEFWEIMKELAVIDHSLNTSAFFPLAPNQHYTSMSTWLQNSKLRFM